MTATRGSVTVVDARGMRCPWPALRLARALRDGRAAVEILADDPIAEQELRTVADARGRAFAVVAPGRFRIDF